jgi:hypothetical protein
MASMRTDPGLERAIVLQLLRDDHPRPWSPAELCGEVRADPGAFELAVKRLGADGVLCRAGEEVSAARAARRLDELGLIAL